MRQLNNLARFWKYLLPTVGWDKVAEGWWDFANRPDRDRSPTNTPVCLSHPTRFARSLGGVALTLTFLAVGCGRPPEKRTSVSTIPEVRVVKPERRNLTCTVEQPGFVQAYEETAIYSKVSGFIKKYYVDIGQRVKKDDLIVEILVPELDEDHQQKVAKSSWTEGHRRWSRWPRANSRRRLPN